VEARPFDDRINHHDHHSDVSTQLPHSANQTESPDLAEREAGQSQKHNISIFILTSIAAVVQWRARKLMLHMGVRVAQGLNLAFANNFFLLLINFVIMVSRDRSIFRSVV